MTQDETDELEQLMRRGHEAGIGERYVASHDKTAMKLILHVKPYADTTITRELQSWILDARAQRRGT